MNWKNLSENLIITIVVAITGGFIGYLSSVHTNKKTIESLRPTIEEAIRKETTAIKNEFTTEIKKLKVKGGSNADLSTYPDIDNDAETSIQKDTDTLPQKKKGFFKRIFGKKKE